MEKAFLQKYLQSRFHPVSVTGKLGYTPVLSKKNTRTAAFAEATE